MNATGTKKCAHPACSCQVPAGKNIVARDASPPANPWNVPASAATPTANKPLAQQMSGGPAVWVPHVSILRRGKFIGKFGALACGMMLPY
jgi:hypothetical protein